MTNYNDGKWHFYQGNSNPVHSKSKIDIKCVNYMGEIVECTRHAGVHVWSTPTLFRVVKEYKEPREFWLCEGKVFYDRDSAYRSCSSAGYIRVREVED